ncbi:iron complex outermembrane recepter protein [Sphingomonas gellani]|uniref:Iron complex outermembrane recepter protein n=1 Tax=Sphingomonas gellani TaxID=1166340 RepID=A0A1H8IHC5_9SPHN|nr:TonB-dependent receptor [Sphingomonas gellani]SEN67689.1 iron complex outermembrane recepter protein [Sphingomonas gellani]
MRVRFSRTFRNSAGATALAAALIAGAGTAEAQAGPGQVAQPGPGGAASATGAGTVPNEAANTPAESAIASNDNATRQADATIPGDIVVTAQKRTERLVQVPLAVTAITGDALATQQINETNSLTRAIPSLSYQAGNNPGNNSFRIRGVGTQLFSLGVEAAVAVVTDGVVAPRQAQGFADLADLERVEVLRGPQGTLFGKNATAGVINIVTARPAREFGGRVDGTIAEDGEYRVKGTVTGPLTDTLRARLSSFYNHVGGFIENAATGNDTNGQKSWGVRGKLEWDATPNLNLLLTGDHNETRADCCSRVPVRIVTPAVQALLGSITASPGNRMVSNDDASFFDTNTTVASLQANWDLGPATVTSISAFQRFTESDQFEPDQIASDPVRYVGAFPYSQWNQNASQFQYNNYSQELRLGSNGTRDLTYVVGVFYNRLDLARQYNRRRQRCAAGTLGQPCTVTSADSSGFNGTFRSDNLAGFGQVDWRVAGGLHAIGGLRYQYEKQTVTGTVFGPLVTGDALFPGTVINSGTRSRDDRALTGRAGLRYEVNRNLQFYGTYTRGYKAFALDLDVSTNFATQTGIAPEHVNAYELGAKWLAPGGMFDINAALFRSDFTNLQVQALVTDVAAGTFQTVLANAGKSRSQGFEIEATMRPSSNFTVAANFTLLDATIDVPGQSCPIQVQSSATVYTSNFPTNSCYIRRQTVNGVTTSSNPIIDVVGGNLPATPRYRVGLTPRYEHDIGGWSAFVQVGINYQSEVNFALNQDPLLVQKGYALVDGSIGFHDADNRYNLTFFVRNLFDEHYFTQLNHGTILATTANPNDLWANVSKDADRYVGATFGVRF